MIAIAWRRAKVILLISLLMCVVFLCNLLLDGLLNQYGVRPRQTDSLGYIYTMPFLHGSLSHLLNNLAGFLIFGWLCVLRPIGLFYLASFVIISLGGFFVWMFGRDAIHIGASGWIFGLWSLNIAFAWFDRKLLNIVIAVGVMFLYGGMIYGVLPQGGNVSFESHLAGFFAGIVAAWVCSTRLGVRISRSKK
ncbi:MAG: rhomboid family intramembrane serine protease [Hahellaceae bacterium]|jgi:membrane associated rhomboid family serine protease|nr:rhomboid family intramembrane serine protease [Hahellaceae bacterium]MCP5213168.1 rhomboid family intramembrane serine protease [Hahellaceae bacterium]